MNKRIQKHTATLHRTDHYTKEQIDYLQNKANDQNQRIARVYFNNMGRGIGPTRIHKTLFPDFPAKQEWMITSTRRAINNLTKAGILVKTKETMPSLQDGTEHLWRWRKPTEQIQKRPPSHRDLLEKYGGKQQDFYEEMYGRSE